MLVRRREWEELPYNERAFVKKGKGPLYVHVADSPKTLGYLLHVDATMNTSVVVNKIVYAVIGEDTDATGSRKAMLRKD